MRLSTLFLLFSISLATGCGSDNDESTSSYSSGSSSSIAIGPTNPVTIKEGEFYRPTTFVDDSANDRWLIADRMQGIIAVNKTSNLRTILTPLSSDETGLQNITDMALDPATNTLYILDATAKNIAVIDSDGDITETLDSDMFDDLVDAGWGAPTSLFFDTTNQRLLIGDRAGLEIENSDGDTTYAFCVFIYTPTNDSISIMSEIESRESPRSFIYDIYYDADNERLFASGLVSINSIGFYAAQIITESDWASVSYFYIKADASISSTAVLHNITYDPEHTAVYAVDSDDKTIYGFNLSLLSDDNKGLERTAITNGNDGKAYPFQRPTSISFDTELGLLLMDETNRTLVSIDHVELPQTPPGEQEDDETTEETEPEVLSATRNLLVAGTPLSSAPASFLQFPYDLVIEPISDTLIITDRSDAQRNAIVSDINGYTPWSFNFNVDLITPYNVNYDSSEDAPVPSAPSITEPKPILLAKNQRDDMFMYALSFSTQSDDEYVHHRYPAGIYQRLGSEGNDADFAPVSTFDITTNGETKTYMQDFSGAFAPSELRDFAVIQGGIIFHYEKISSNSTRSFITFWEKSKNVLITVSSNSTSYNARNVTGMVLSQDESTLYFTDAYHDALISVALNTLDDTPSFEFTVISGRQHEGDYMPLPAGLALNQAETKAWVFDNAIKAIIEIDLETGNRTRLDSTLNYIQSIKSLELSEDETTLYLIEKSLNRVISIDLIEDYPQNWLTPTGESSAE